MNLTSYRLLCTVAIFASLLLFGTTAKAQDVVTLHSVTIAANNAVTVVYSKNFATCAHLRFNNATCTQMGALTHVANHFCTQGNQVSVTLQPTAFVAGFGPGIRVFMVHGNNSNVASACVTVACDGSYGAACAGSAGPPLLDATSECPPAGSTVALTISNAPPGSIAIMGFGIGQANVPLFGCTLLLQTIVATIVVPCGATGSGTVSLGLPAGSTGAIFAAQGFTIDAGGPQGFAATNGLLLRVL